MVKGVCVLLKTSAFSVRLLLGPNFFEKVQIFTKITFRHKYLKWTVFSSSYVICRWSSGGRQAGSTSLKKEAANKGLSVIMHKEIGKNLSKKIVFVKNKYGILFPSPPVCDRAPLDNQVGCTSHRDLSLFGRCVPAR